MKSDMVSLDFGLALDPLGSISSKVFGGGRGAWVDSRGTVSSVKGGKGSVDMMLLELSGVYLSLRGVIEFSISK